jgi:hypothetical protein
MIELDFQHFIGETLNEGAGSRNFSSAANYSARVYNGHGLEYEIRQAMREDLGWITKDASPRDDMHGGIDCWIVSKDNGKSKISQIPLQIKARKNSSGNDIKWETIKNWTDNIGTTFQQLGNKIFTGKDMKCTAQLLVCVSNDGQYLRFRNVSEILDISRDLGKNLIETYLSNGRKVFSNAKGQIRVLKDPSQQSNAVMRGDVWNACSFISPDAFEWKWDVKLSAPIDLF